MKAADILFSSYFHSKKLVVKYILTVTCRLLNTPSLVKKVDHFHYFIGKYKPQVIFTTESWLSSKILDSELLRDLPLSIVRKDSNRKVESARPFKIWCFLMKSASNVKT